MARRRRDIQPDGSNINPGNMGNPGGDSNMNDFGKFLNNVDLNQLMGQFSQMMGGPQGGAQGPQGGGQGSPQGGFRGNPQGGGFPGGFQPPKQAPRDPRMQLMQAIKPFLSKRRAGMLDNIGQLYGVFNIVKGMKKR